MLAFVFFQKEKGENGITGFLTFSEKEKRKGKFRTVFCKSER